jgi:acetate kinase
MNEMRVLVVNAGSSSLKLALIDENDQTVAAKELPAPHAKINEQELQAALDGDLGKADIVGHRIVHGGGTFDGPVRITAKVESALRELVELAPLHQPKSLAALDAVSAALPNLPAVACFDTAFHANLPLAASTYALPAAWREGYGIRRYGFHGLSHAWIAHRVPQVVGRDPADLRIVSCHLGAGASLCAILGGRSIDTTMGFTPLEGLVMATRSGSVDPGLLLWLLGHANLTAAEMADALENASGLVGLTGTPDMRDVLTRAHGGDQAAQLGLDVYLHRLRAAIAAMTATLGGIDVLAFTGGVGEGSNTVRRRAVDGLAFLGLGISEQANNDRSEDRDISSPGATATTVVIAAREDLEIARQTRSLGAKTRQLSRRLRSVLHREPRR